MACTGPLEEVRSLFAIQRAEVEALAADVPAGCGSTFMLPYFAGERTPPWCCLDPHEPVCLCVSCQAPMQLLRWCCLHRSKSEQGDPCTT